MFAKRNAMVVRYVWMAALVTLVLAGTFGATEAYLSQRLKVAGADISSKQNQIASYHDLEEKIKSLNSRITSIKSIQGSQAKFSSLLGDLSHSMPAGVALTALTLTGDDKKPVSISAAADSYNSAVGLRDTLAASSRIAAADIQTVSNTKDGYHVDILLSFKPGMAK